MELLPHNASDADLIAFADRWAELMESEDYAAVYALTEHDPHMKWTPTLLGEVVKAYGDASPGQKVTLHGKPTDITQRKEVHRWKRSATTRWVKSGTTSTLMVLHLI